MSSLNIGRALGRSEMKKLLAGSGPEDCDDPDYCVCWTCDGDTSSCYRGSGNEICPGGGSPECCGTCSC